MLNRNKIYVLIFLIILMFYFINCINMPKVIKPYENKIYTINNKYNINNFYKIKKYIENAKYKEEEKDKNKELKDFSNNKFEKFINIILKDYEKLKLKGSKKHYLIPNTKLGDIYIIENFLSNGKNIVFACTEDFQNICIYTNINETDENINFNENEVHEKLQEDVNLIMNKSIYIDFKNAQLLDNKYIVNDKDDHIYIEYDISLNVITYFQYNFDNI